MDDALFTLILLRAFLETSIVSESNPSPVAIPAWLLKDVCKILDQRIPTAGPNGTPPGGVVSLEAGFHLLRRPGRNQMDNAQRDFEISVFADMLGSLKKLADCTEEWGIPPPGPGKVWTEDALAKAIRAHERRNKEGLMFPSSPEKG